MQYRYLLMSLVIVFVFFSTAYASSISENTILRQGMHNDEVYIVQNKLRELGYFKGIPDGTFGATTYSAIVRFQKASGLDPDGVAGYQTLKALQVFQNTSDLDRKWAGKRTGEHIVDSAKRLLGTPYVWGGSNLKGFDCSGFVFYVFKEDGVYLPRMADDQYKMGFPVRQKDLQLGDLVFFSTYEPGPSHVGIYSGNGQFIHASSGNGHVIITSLDQPYFMKRYLGARRLIGEN